MKKYLLVFSVIAYLLIHYVIPRFIATSYEGVTLVLNSCEDEICLLSGTWKKNA